MNKDWMQFEVQLKRKIKPKLKGATADDGEKVKKRLLDKLEEAYDFEDEMKDSIKDALEEGFKGKKPDDFMGYAPFKKAVENWKKAVSEHKDLVKEVSDHSTQGRKVQKSLKKIYEPIAKDVDARIKKKTISDPDKKTMKKLLGEAEEILSGTEKSADLYGKLKAHQIFYGARQDQAVAIFVKKVVDKVKGKDLPKILEEAQGKKNVKVAERMAANLAQMCEQAVEQKSGDPKQSDKTLKNVNKLMRSLKKLNTSYQTAAKKQASDLEKAKNVKKLKEIIASINASHTKAEKCLENAMKQMKKVAA